MSFFGGDGFLHPSCLLLLQIKLQSCHFWRRILWGARGRKCDQRLWTSRINARRGPREGCSSFQFNFYAAHIISQKLGYKPTLHFCFIFTTFSVANRLRTAVFCFGLLEKWSLLQSPEKYCVNSENNHNGLSISSYDTICTWLGVSPCSFI